VLLRFKVFFSGRSSRRMPRLALAQRTAWQRLRKHLHHALDDQPVQTIRLALSAFDSLPFRRCGTEAMWLPREDELACMNRGLLPALTRAGVAMPTAVLASLTRKADEEMRLVQAAAESAEEPTISLHRHRRDAVCSLVLRGAASGEQTAFSVTARRLEWLRRAHRHHMAVAGQSADVLEAAFRRRAFRMLARYDGVGGGLGGAGNQAAVPSEVYAALETAFDAPAGSAAEAFASPLNHRLHRDRAARAGAARQAAVPSWFGTAFPDVDRPFGSIGSFFSLARLPPSPPTTTPTPTPTPPHLMLLNPPFVSWAMEALTPALTRLLSSAAADGDASGGRAYGAAPAVALVVVPALGKRSHDEARHVDLLEGSSFLRCHGAVAAGEHSFVTGLAHRRTRGHGRHRHASRYPTALYVLSNAEADLAFEEEHFRALLAAAAHAFRRGGPD